MEPTPQVSPQEELLFADPVVSEAADLGAVRVFPRQGNTRAAVRIARSWQLLTGEAEETWALPGQRQMIKMPF